MIRHEIALSMLPEDVDELLRYLDGDHHMGAFDRLQVTRQIRAQLPPASKPPEPTGLGAVVIDIDGVAWVRADKDDAPWVSPVNWWSAYDDVDAVEILSDGVDQ